MSSAASRACPVCGQTDVTTVGPVLHPQPALVAGVPIELGDTPYRLRRCRACEFQFKDPPVDPQRLLECYAQSKASNWEVDPDPWQRRFDMLRGLLELHARGRRVLDVGCFNGALLKYLGAEWQQFGVEPSREAAELARQRGVEILAADLESLGPNVPPFDAILAIDVVEHVVEPVPFFVRMLKRLAPRGIIVLLTGDTDSLAWRLQGGAYWYSSLPEHVSFYNQASLDWIGRKLGLQRLDFRRVCHKRFPRARWCMDVVKSAAYVGGKSVGGLGLPALRRWCVERRGPTISTARDHMMCVYGKTHEA